MAEAARIALALATGLLVGSVLPCELFARWCSVDIRTVGDGNPGAYNAFLGLGASCGVATALYDLSAGVAALLAARALGVPEGVAYLAGIMAIVGHRFPVYKGFRGGGQAMAAAAGLVVYGAALATSQGWLSWVDLAIVAAIGTTTFVFTRAGKDIAIVMLPVLVFMALASDAPWEFKAFESVAAGHIWLTQVLLTVRAIARPAEEPARREPPAE